MGVVAYIAALVAIIAVSVWSWNRRYRGTKWAINLGRVSCPRCGQSLPAMRIPRTRELFKWGGWTCGKCGCDVDKHGKETTVSGRGRHDPCVLPRAVPIVEAMAALVLADFMLRNKTSRLHR